jgi:murein DD-endopeptidase MepM/ murein hydrolase activator NlpD
MTTFEHPHLNAGFDYLDVSDKSSTTAIKLDGRGYSLWATPRSTVGFEGLFRFDHLTPNQGAVAELRRNRTIAGVAYWFPHQGAVSAAVLLDFEQVNAKTISGTVSSPTQKRFAVHGLINF